MRSWLGIFLFSFVRIKCEIEEQIWGGGGSKSVILTLGYSLKLPEEVLTSMASGDLPQTV